jgi:hypothetical protein
MFSCTVKIKNYELRVLEYPEWIHTEFPGFAGPERKPNMEYNNTSMFVWDSQVNGADYSTLEAVIDPRLFPINYLYIKELSFVRDSKKIYLIKNKKIMVPYNLKDIANLKFRNYPKYFGNMKLDESVDVTVTLIYQFDDGPIITEETPYRITCFEYEYNPLDNLFLLSNKYITLWYPLWILSFILLLIIYVKNIISKIFCNNIVKIIPIIPLIISIFSIVSFSNVFIFNQGSNVAQYSDSFNLWAFWFQIYTFLFFSNIFNLIFSLFSVVINRKIYIKRNILYIIILIINIILNIFIIIPHFPDA